MDGLQPSKAEGTDYIPIAIGTALATASSAKPTDLKELDEVKSAPAMVQSTKIFVETDVYRKVLRCRAPEYFIK